MYTVWYRYSENRFRRLGSNKWRAPGSKCYETSRDRTYVSFFFFNPHPFSCHFRFGTIATHSRIFWNGEVITSQMAFDPRLERVVFSLSFWKNGSLLHFFLFCHFVVALFIHFQVKILTRMCVCMFLTSFNADIVSFFFDTLFFNTCFLKKRIVEMDSFFLNRFGQLVSNYSQIFIKS